MDDERPTSADEARRWGVGVLGAGLVFTAAARRGIRGTQVVSLVLAGSFGVAVFGARRMLANTIIEARHREGHQRTLIDAQLGQALVGAHDALNSVEPELRALLVDAKLAPEITPAIEESLKSIIALAQLLRGSAPARDALSDEEGFVPFVGINASQQHKRGPRAVRPLYGARNGLPRFVPSELRAAARQVGLVLDETRLLHTADVERAVLLFTVVSRALLVSLSPALGDWTPVRQPLAGGFRAVDIPWAVATATSVATALIGPRIVRMTMEDSPAGQRFRYRLLLIEAPVGAATLFFSPSWTVVVFATGMINWWQRQSKTMSFSWAKLSIYITGVVAFQSGGLAREHLPVGASALEVFGALAAILITGASYGAMLPLTIGTALDVLIGDGRRSLRAVLRARGELLRAARQLNETAELIDASAPDSETAHQAAMTARRAAQQIEHAADRAGRRRLLSSQLLPELMAEAIARSFLSRRGTSELEELQQSAKERAEAPPAYATEPIFLTRELLSARLGQQRHARALRAIVEHSLNEARIHGTGAVRIIVAGDATGLDVRIGNRTASGDTVGIAGQGGSSLRRLAQRLPEGTIKRGQRSADEMRMPHGDGWWVVQLTCAASIFDLPHGPAMRLGLEQKDSCRRS
jgi:hypothetical protein